jgi:hypothetical protein
MNVPSITPVPSTLTPTDALRASSRFDCPWAWMSAAIPSIQASRPARSRASKTGEGSHRSAFSATIGAVLGSAAQAVAVRRAASAAWSRATSSRSSVVAARISATGAVAGRKTAAIAPRTRPIPSEKKRVI